jgi:hypothetical protein
MTAFQNEKLLSVKWALWFSYLNLRRCRKRQLEQIRMDLFDFLMPPKSGGVELFQGPEPTRQGAIELRDLCFTASLELLESLQQTLKDDFLLFACVEEELDDVGVEVAVGPILISSIEKAHLIGFRTRPNQPFGLQIEWNAPGNLPGCIRTALCLYLAFSQILGSQLRLCPECKHRVFLIDRKPRADRIFYCSRTCSWNASTKRYRARERERSHRRFAAKTRRKAGMSNVRVARRPNQTTKAAFEFARGGPISIVDPGDP